MLAKSQKCSQIREANRRHARQRHVPRMWIVPVQEKWSYPPWEVKPRRAPAFGPARHWRFAGGALRARLKIPEMSAFARFRVPSRGGSITYIPVKSAQLIFAQVASQTATGIFKTPSNSDRGLDCGAILRAQGGTDDSGAEASL